MSALNLKADSNEALLILSVSSPTHTREMCVCVPTPPSAARQPLTAVQPEAGTQSRDQSRKRVFLGTAASMGIFLLLIEKW